MIENKYNHVPFLVPILLDHQDTSEVYWCSISMLDMVLILYLSFVVLFNESEHTYLDRNTF